MTDLKNATQTRGNYGQCVREVLAQIEQIIADGLHHGFFRCSITCEIEKGGRRDLLIVAGKSHKFIIPEDEVPR